MPISKLKNRHMSPLAFLSDPNSRVCLVILNQPLEPFKGLVSHLWSKACFKVCADGGANRLYDFSKSRQTSFVPDLISGDFDSIRKDVKEFYKSRGATIVHTPDQNETDFTKALRHLYKHVEVKYQSSESFDSTVVLVGYGGRPDHAMANIHTLFKSSEINDKPCFLLSESSLTCLLAAGMHTLRVDTGLEDDWCGLVPIGAPARVKTTGLKWNLDNDELNFGSLVSTSNTFKGSRVVTIETSNPLLWLMGFRSQSLGGADSSS